MDKSPTDPMIERLERLEEENRQLTKQLHRFRQEHRLWRRAGGLIAIGALVLVCAAPRFRDEVTCPSITTNRLIVENPRRPGTPRIAMLAEPDQTILRISGSDGRPQIELVVSDRDLPYIYFKDPQGNILRRVP
jgi:hypothetical protein